ncbi:polyprenyl synthetase family protein [Promicromonospora thailandica]|uniref:Geranylgeranyl diphosphate synthase, type I n=1 Tax=Promicromonospora thailandica TaxID=765201 RepID=A0A9X2JX70_9MICO|nr:polyprenyl synthetase family protein [Promicromonospora thailandica]MCP2265893.1 geranylgeranyl diphosphate synthase, type I [Promicromonospora thailandica]
MSASSARTGALTPAALLDAEGLRADVDAAVSAHLALLGAEVSAISPSARAMVDEATGLLTGGKRLRAAFCYWSFRAHGGSASPDDPARVAAVRVGAALELFQAAALLHDDVMDNSDTRRGRPTAHRAFAAEHAASGWAGEPDRFGDAAAILLGDLVLLAAQRELSAALAPLPADVAEPVRARFDAMQSEVVVGQYLDVLVQAEPWGDDPAADEERARRVLRAKTASYSAAAPLAMGALLAGRGAEAAAGIEAAGLPLGEAFQLRDDVLGVFGDPAVTGKPAGDDLREGKRTVIVARTLAMLPDPHGAEATALGAALGDQALTDEDVERVRGIIVGSGALDAVEHLIDDLAVRAHALLDLADLSEPGRGVLTDLAHAAVDRAA